MHAPIGSRTRGDITDRCGAHWLTRAIPLIGLIFLVSNPALAQRSYRADLHHERGARALRSLDATTALEQLELALEIAPEDADTLGLYARALLLADRPEDALSALSRLEATRPGAPDLELMQGLSHYRLRQWPSARMHLLAASAAEPESSRIRLFLGVAHQKMGESDEAERAFDEAVRLDPTLAVAGNYRKAMLALDESRDSQARAFFEAIVAEVPGSVIANSASIHLLRMDRGEGQGWQAEVFLGYAYDNNVNLIGDGDAFIISNNNDSRGETGVRLEGLAWEGQRSALRVGWTGLASAHRHERRLDTELSDAWLMGSYALTDQITANLRYDFSWVWADWDSYLRTHVVEPSLRVSMRDDLFAQIFYRYSDRGFFTDDTRRELDRDGDVQTVGIDQYWLLPQAMGGDNGFVRLGGRYRGENTEGADFDSKGAVLITTVGLDLPLETFLTIEGWFERRVFDNSSVLAPGKGDRNDNITQAWVELRRPISMNLWARVSFRYTHWSSNVAAYDFDQAVTDFRITYRY